MRVLSEFSVPLLPNTRVVKARILRGGEVKEMEITLGERPARKG
jgi:hypothetical protein